MEYKKIEDLVVELSQDPFNPELNFKCAVEYEKLNQTASAVSFYLRCAEFGHQTHTLLAYNSLLRISRCFENQRDRHWNVSNYIYHALSIDPNRPEAYFMASQFHEKSGNWQECYTWACLGLSKNDVEPLPFSVNYYGSYCLEFEKAISGWWIGQAEESKSLLLKLKDMDIAEEYKNSVIENLRKI